MTVAIAFSAFIKWLRLTSMCRTQNCENCQQKQNPTPQQIRRFPFPQCQSHKNSEQPWQIFPLFIFSMCLNRLSTDPEEFQFRDICGRAIQGPDTDVKKRWYPQRFWGNAMAFPLKTQSLQLKVSERRQWPQTELKDMVTGLFNTKRRLFLWRPLKPSWSAALQTFPLWQPSRCRR